MASWVPKSFSYKGVERTARMAASGCAIFAVMVALLFETGLLSKVAQYDRLSWYLVSQHDGFVVTTRVEDERECRQRQQPEMLCYSGSSMIAQQPTVTK